MASWATRLASVVAEPPAHVGALVGLRRLTLPPTFERLRLRLLAHVTDSQLVAALSVVLSICAYVWYASSGATLGYGDALSRMVIARRVVAGAATGLGQLGTTWLPLHTMLMLPLVWNNALFRSGLAGSIPSMIAYVVAAVYIFRMAHFFFAARSTAWIAALIFMLNPSVLYMQCTAMSEIPLLCGVVLAMFFMLRWARSYHALDLVKSATAVAACAGIRYDGWVLAVALATLVIFVGWRRQGLAGAESNLLLFGILAFSSCVAWVIYNLVIFHDPILFLFFGDTSHKLVPLVSYHKALLSLQMYVLAAAETAGWVMFGLAVLGLIVFIVRRRAHTASLPAYVLLLPIPYHWLIFYLGVDCILLPQLGLGEYWNARFGLMIMPAIVFFVACLAHQHNLLRWAVLLATLGFLIVNLTIEMPMSEREPLEYSSVSTARIVDQHKAADWLAAHYQGGSILLSDQPDAPLLFYLLRYIPDENVITDTPTDRFQVVLAHPEAYTSWIVVDKTGAPYGPVYRALSQRHDWQQYYVLRATYGPVEVFQRIGSGS